MLNVTSIVVVRVEVMHLLDLTAGFAEYTIGRA